MLLDTGVERKNQKRLLYFHLTVKQTGKKGREKKSRVILAENINNSILGHHGLQILAVLNPVGE